MFCLFEIFKDDMSTDQQETDQGATLQADILKSSLNFKIIYLKVTFKAKRLSILTSEKLF
jgi:hypothetical protein